MHCAAARASVPRSHTFPLLAQCPGGGCLDSSAPRVLLCTSTCTLVLEGSVCSPTVPQG